MTNSIFIDLDTERENPIIFGKSPEITPPSNKTEAKIMILSDIATVTDALKTLILMAHDNDYGDKSELVSLAISSIYELNKNKENEPKEDSQGSDT